MLRDAYIAWTRRAIPLLALPMVLTALVQTLSASPGWASGPDAPLGVRSMFVAVAVASVAYGRGIRQRDTKDRPLTVPKLVALSWQLLITAVLPSAIGAVLAVMTRSPLDFYLLLLLTLVALIVLYPRYDQWMAWSAPRDGEA